MRAGFLLLCAGAIAMYLCGLSAWALDTAACLAPAHTVPHQSADASHSILCQALCHAAKGSAAVSSMVSEVRLPITLVSSLDPPTPPYACDCAICDSRAPPPAPVRAM